MMTPGDLNQKLVSSICMLIIMDDNQEQAAEICWQFVITMFNFAKKIEPYGEL